MAKTTLKKYLKLKAVPVIQSDTMIQIGGEVHEDVYDWCSSTPVMLDLDAMGEITNHRLVTRLEV